MRIAGRAAWPIHRGAYEDFPEKGELFLYGWMAIEQTDGSVSIEAVEFGRTREDEARGLVGALAWHEPEQSAPLVREWIGAPGCVQALSRCGGLPRPWGRSEGYALAGLFAIPTRACAPHSLRLAGTLKRADLVREIAGRA